MTRMWKTPVAISLAAALAACGSDKKQDPTPTTTAKPTTPAAPTPTTPAAPTPTTPAMPPPDPASPLAIVEVPGEASCFDYRVERGGAIVAQPKAVATALACPIVPPTLTRKKDAIVLLSGEELMHWTPGSEPKRLVKFDPGVEGVSAPTWSPDGTRLAVVVKGTGYPQSTRLFVLTVSTAGDVTDKVKQDVAVFAPCGSVCTPEAVEWKDDKTVVVTTPGEAEPGPPKTITL